MLINGESVLGAEIKKWCRGQFKKTPRNGEERKEQEAAFRIIDEYIGNCIIPISDHVYYNVVEDKRIKLTRDLTKSPRNYVKGF